MIIIIIVILIMIVISLILRVIMSMIVTVIIRIILLIIIIIIVIIMRIAPEGPAVRTRRARKAAENEVWCVQTSQYIYIYIYNMRCVQTSHR